jgi:hypothetical protein
VRWSPRGTHRDCPPRRLARPPARRRDARARPDVYRPTLPARDRDAESRSTGADDRRRRGVCGADPSAASRRLRLRAAHDALSERRDDTGRDRAREPVGLCRGRQALPEGRDDPLGPGRRGTRRPRPRARGPRAPRPPTARPRGVDRAGVRRLRSRAGVSRAEPDPHRRAPRGLARRLRAHHDGRRRRMGRERAAARRRSRRSICS